MYGFFFLYISNNNDIIDNDIINFDSHHKFIINHIYGQSAPDLRKVVACNLHGQGSCQ